MKFFLPLLFLTSVFSSVSALAYNPPYLMIMSRAAENHGRGSYVIEQDVTFRNGPETLTVHEIWTVADENRMRLTFQGVGPLKDTVSGGFVYESSSRLENDGKGVHKHHVGDDWSEPLFHFRYSKPMRTHLVQMKIAPPESLKERAPLKSDGPPDYEAESYVQLARQKGLVTWAVARVFDNTEPPELWIAQDQFTIAKVRNPDKTSVEADDYSKYDGGLYFPKTRSYKWNDTVATAQLRSVKSLGTGKVKDLSNASSLPPMQVTAQTSDMIKEFYQRFR